MWYLTEEEVSQLLTVEEAIPLVRQVLEDAGHARVDVVPRRRARTSRSVLALMGAAWEPEGGRPLLGIKAYAASRQGTHFVVVVWDGETGRVEGIVEADRLGQVRTGAASAVATDALAREDSQRLLVIGAGYQARTQVEAIAHVRSLRLVQVYSRTKAHREAFAQEISRRLGISAQAVDDPAPAAQEADVVVTITTAATPVLLGRWLSPGVHVNAAGSNHPEHAEVDAEVLHRAQVVAVDHMEGARLEAGDLRLAEREGWSFSRAVELGDILAGRAPGRSTPKDITVFASQGIASEDLVVAAHVLRKAKEQGIGREIPATAR
jgi:alanine dehydrogenase